MISLPGPRLTPADPPGQTAFDSSILTARMGPRRPPEWVRGYGIAARKGMLA
jgi:hypothetical protein